MTEKAPAKAENEDAKKAKKANKSGDTVKKDADEDQKKDAAEDQKEGEKPKEMPGKSG